MEAITILRDTNYIPHQKFPKDTARTEKNGTQLNSFNDEKHPEPRSMTIIIPTFWDAGCNNSIGKVDSRIEKITLQKLPTLHLCLNIIFKVTSRSCKSLVLNRHPEFRKNILRLDSVCQSSNDLEVKFKVIIWFFVSYTTFVRKMFGIPTSSEHKMSRSFRIQGCYRIE